MEVFIIAILIGYLFGCVHGASIIGTIKHINIAQEGVKNPGAANTTLLLGWKYGIIVALFDIGKTPLAIWFFSLLMHTEGHAYDLLFPLLVGSSVVIGHMFPFRMGFKGGKGTASAIGLFFALDWKIGLITFMTIVVIGLLSDYLVIGVFAMYVSFCLCVWLFDLPFQGLLVAVFLTLLSAVKHVENYRRIISKQETRVSSTFRKKRT